MGERRVSALRKFQPAVSKCESTPPYGRARVVQCFIDADLRCMTPGLIKICEDHGIRVETLKKGCLIPFINRDRNFIKVIACNETFSPVLGVYRLPEGRIYDLRVIGMIPSAFKADGTIDFSEAIRMSIEKYFEKRQRQRLDTIIVRRAQGANAT